MKTHHLQSAQCLKNFYELTGFPSKNRSPNCWAHPKVKIIPNTKAQIATEPSWQKTVQYVTSSISKHMMLCFQKRADVSRLVWMSRVTTFSRSWTIFASAGEHQHIIWEFANVQKQFSKTDVTKKMGLRMVNVNTKSLVSVEESERDWEQAKSHDTLLLQVEKSPNPKFPRY